MARRNEASSLAVQPRAVAVAVAVTPVAPDSSPRARSTRDDDVLAPPISNRGRRQVKERFNSLLTFGALPLPFGLASHLRFLDEVIPFYPSIRRSLSRRALALALLRTTPCGRNGTEEEAR